MAAIDVYATWDPEAGVWVAESEDVPGLATEADTIEAIADKLRTLIPELLDLNGIKPPTEDDSIPFDIHAERSDSASLATG